MAHWNQKDEKQKASARQRWFRGCAGLWTYNGDWGVMEEITVPMTRTASVQDEIDDVVHQCQRSKKLLELWQGFEKFWRKNALEFRALRPGVRALHQDAGRFACGARARARVLPRFSEGEH